MPPAPRNDAKRDFRLAELGGVGSYDEVTQHGQLAASAKSIAGNRSNNRFPVAGHAIERCDQVALVGA